MTLAVACPIEVDRDRGIVTVNGTPVHLTRYEFRLVLALSSDPVRVFTKADLLRAIWGHGATAPTRTLDTHAYRVRQKFAALGVRSPINVWGVGYRLLDPTSTEVTG